MSEWIDKDLGPVDAYALAVAGGYEGTKQQWIAEIAGASTNASNTEAYAKGTRGGEAVASDDPAYHKNAKYYNEQAALEKASAQAAAATASAAYNVNLLAANYDATKTYAVGDHVIYSGGYYCCNTAITTAEAWTAAHWTQLTLGDEAADLKSALSNSDEGYLLFDSYGIFVNGYIEDGIVKTFVKYRITSNQIFVFDRDIKIVVSSGFQFDYQTFVGGVYNSNSGWKTGTITIPANTYFKCMIARVTEDTSEIADISVFITKAKIITALNDNLQTQITENHNAIIEEQAQRPFITPGIKEITPMFVRKALDISTGAESTSLSNCIFPCFLKNIRTIRTTLTGVETRVFFYGDTGHSDFKGYKVKTLTQNVTYNIEYVNGATECLVLIRFTDSHNFAPDSIQGKVFFGVNDTFDIFDISFLIHNNLDSSNGFLGGEYQYRYCFPFMYNINDIYKIATASNAKALVVFYSDAGIRVGATGYYRNTVITKETIETNIANISGTVSYCGILFDAPATTYNFTVSDYGKIIFIAGDESENYICDNIVLDKDLYYGGERIALGKNRISYVKDRFNIGYPYSQDGDSYGKYFVRVGSTGLVKIFDLVTLANSGGGSLAQFEFDGNPPHGNAVFFGTEKYDEDDYFPLLYVNAYNSEYYDWGTLFAYRVQYSNSTLTLTKVQTINIGFYNTSLWYTGNDSTPYGNFACDKDRNRLIAYTTLDGDVNKTRFFIFNMPTLTDGETVTLAAEDIIEYFDVDKQKFPQGCVCYHNRVYALSGFSTFDDGNYLPGLLNVVDLDEKKTVSVVNLTSIGLNEEPECIFIYNNQIITGYLSGHILNV